MHVYVRVYVSMCLCGYVAVCIAICVSSARVFIHTCVYDFAYMCRYAELNA